MTVNPDKDDTQQLKEYCEMFDKKDLIGLREESNMALNL